MSDAKYRASCDACLNSKVKCSQAKPACNRCTQHGQQCVYSRYRKIGRPSYKTLASIAGDQRTAQKKTKKQSPIRQTEPNDLSGYQNVDFNEDVALSDGNSVTYGDTFMASSSSSTATTSQILRDDQATDIIDWASMSPIPNSELNITDFGSLDIEMQNTNWVVMNDGLDLTTIASPLTSQSILQPQETATTRGLSGANNVTDSAVQSGVNHFTSSLLSSSSSSHGSISSASPTPSFSLSSSHDPPTSSTSQIRRNHSNFPSPNQNGPQQPVSTLQNVTIKNAVCNPTARGSSTGRDTQPPSFSLCDPQSTSQCQIILNNQLNYLSECQADESTRAAIDILLNLDDRVRRERDRILRCTVCMGNCRRGQTLMLATMVVGKVLGLFEAGFVADRRSSSRNSSQSGHCSLFTRSGSSEPSTGNSSVTSSGSASPFPHTTRPLTIGNVQLDEEVKRAFSRQLLRIYLERQKAAVAHLEQLLVKVDDRDVTHKITLDLLTDLSTRAEYFLGVFALTDGFDSASRVQKLIAS